jgi:hypothetical protein
MSNTNSTPEAPAESNAPAFVTPEALSRELGFDAKIIRAYLRVAFVRPLEAKGTSWVLDSEQADMVRAHFNARRALAVRVEGTPAESK